jgi:molybdate transport system regulatory protein
LNQLTQRGFIMKASARNQFTGTVSEVRVGAVNAEVDINTAGGEQIVVTMINDSVESLVLHEGQAATAIFKAGAVILAVAG